MPIQNDVTDGTLTMPTTSSTLVKSALTNAKHLANRHTPLVEDEWYVAAFSKEVGRELLQRTLLGHDIVLYRTREGTPIALSNRCVHRSFPLSDGTLDGDSVVCGYHGLCYDQAGVCINVPSQTKKPEGIGVRAFPLVENGPIIWIWTGDESLADARNIPLQDWMSDPDWPSSEELLHLNANYVGLHENLLDLTHLSFLHAGSFGTPDYATAPFETHIDDDSGTYAVKRSVIPTRLPPIWAEPTGLTGRDAARVTNSTFWSPGLHVVNAHFYDVGVTEQERGNMQIKTAHIPTPETQSSTHYFVYHARNFAIEDESVTSFMHTNLLKAFHEDVVGLEAIESLHHRNTSSDDFEISFAADKVPLAMRRYLKKRSLDQRGATE